VIERFRTRHDIDDPARPFGHHHDARQRDHLAHIREELDAVMDGPRRDGPEFPAQPAQSSRLLPGP
jgi:hypothetical protein